MTTQTGNGERNMRTLGAIALIGVGIMFLASNIFNIRFDFWGSVWPFFVIVPGVAMLALAFSGDKNTEGFVYPGAIVTGTGAILLYQNVTNHWESWAYMWTLYPVFIGLALGYHGRRTGDQNNIANGRNMVRSGLIMLLIFGAFFEIIIFDRFGGAWDTLLPLGFIAAGAYLLFGNRRRTISYGEKAKIKNDDAGSSLQQRIDQALAEDEKPKTPENV